MFPLPSEGRARGRGGGVAESARQHRQQTAQARARVHLPRIDEVLSCKDGARHKGERLFGEEARREVTAVRCKAARVYLRRVHRFRDPLVARCDRVHALGIGVI